jgi:hypothetical protein
MKLLLSLTFAFISLNAWAAPNLNQKITLTVRNVTATEAIKEISQHSGVEFIVNPKLQFTKKISIDVKEASLKDVLEFLTIEQNVKWEAGNGNTIKILANK